MPLLRSELKRNILKLGSGRDSSPPSPRMFYFGSHLAGSDQEQSVVQTKRNILVTWNLNLGDQFDSNETRVTKANQLFYRFYWNGFRASGMEKKKNTWMKASFYTVTVHLTSSTDDLSFSNQRKIVLRKEKKPLFWRPVRYKHVPSTRRLSTLLESVSVPPLQLWVINCSDAELCRWRTSVWSYWEK